MRDTTLRFFLACAVSSAATLLACSGAAPGPDSRTTGTALASPPPAKPHCESICKVGTHCELVAFACLASDPELVGPCPPFVSECVPDKAYPTCNNTPIKCDPGEHCVDVPNDCAPPADGPPSCVPTVPLCEPFPGDDGNG